MKLLGISQVSRHLPTLNNLAKASTITSKLLLVNLNFCEGFPEFLIVLVSNFSLEII